MSSTVDLNMNTTLSSDGKRHIIMIYLIDEEGWYGGGYYEPFWSLMGGVKGRSRETIIDNAYESLEEFIEDEDYVPFDRTNIKESVVFDVIECHTIEEMDRAMALRRTGTNYEEINKAVLE